jgi:lipopolysaccharide biosynthesis regulator YciM
MIKFAVLLFIIFVAALGYLAILNNDAVTVKITEQQSYELPKIALILLSSALGALSILALVIIRDTRRYFGTWQELRNEKKELKVQGFYSKGLDAFFGGKYDEAVEFLTRCLGESPRHVNAMLRRGDIAFHTGDYITAKDYYIKAKDIRPQSVEALFSIEKVFETEKQWKEALRYLDNILEIDEGNPNALYRKREIYEINKNWESVLDIQHHIMKSNIPEKEKEREEKNILGYKYELGQYYLENNEIDKAKKVLKNIIKADHGFAAAYLALAETYLRDNDVKEAEKVLLKGYEETNAIVFLIRLEDFFIDIGEPGKIIDIYQNEIPKKPKEPKLEFLLAKLYYRLEMIDYAFETVMRIDTASADYPDLHTLRGNIYERREEHNRASEEFKKALVKPEKPLITTSFCCTHCNFNSTEWMGRCVNCKQWNTFSLDLSGACKV